MSIRGCLTIFGAFSLLSIGIAAFVDPIVGMVVLAVVAAVLILMMMSS